MIETKENLPTPDGQIVVNDRCIKFSDIEASLRKNSLVEDCVVLSRASADGSVELVAYIVPVLPYAPDRLENQIKSNLPSEVRSFCTPVAAIPLTENGDIDSAALMQTPVIDESLLQSWEKKLGTVAGISRAAVVVQEFAGPAELMHLANLIPGWKPTALQNPDAGVEAGQTMTVTQDSKPRPPAWADGGPLTIPSDAPKTFTEAIQQTAKKFPDKGIAHVRANGEEFFQSYPMLLEQAKRILAGLQAKGMKPGDRVVLQCELLSDHFAAFWACVLGGITPVNVAVPPSYGEKNAIINKLYNIWKLLEHPVVIASEHLVKPLQDLERFFPGEKFNVLSVEELKSHAPTENIHDCKPDDLVFFQLSSGSTGVPKCIQESHRSVIAHIHGSAQYNGYTSDDVILNWLPVDHVVPTLTCNLKDVYMGCKEVQVATNVVISEPLRWLDLMESHKVTHSWAPNFGFKLVSDRLGSAGDRKWDLSSVKFLMNAGEQVTIPVVSEFLRQTAPFGITPLKIQPSFGMAEACTCMTYTNDFSIKTGVHRFLKSTLNTLLQPTMAEDATSIAFIDLGPPIPGVQIRITDAQNQVVPEGKIGRFQIKGDVITRGYLHNDDANKDAFVGDGWFNSGDLGYIWNGRLALTGREKEMIIVRGANFYCYEIEDVVNALPGAQPTFTAAVSVSDPSTGSESLGIFFVPLNSEPAEKVRLIEQIRKSVASNLGISPSVIVPLPKNEFCKTTSGKIQRNQMKKSLVAGQYDLFLQEMDVALGNANTLPNWFYRKTWRRKANVAQPAAVAGASLVFLDQKALGERLCAQLDSVKQSCIQVSAGTDFVMQGGNRYQINPANPDHYRRLLTSVAESGINLGRVFHLGTYRDSTDHSTAAVQSSLNSGVFSLLYLSQALDGMSEAKRPSRLIVASSHSANVKPGDSVDAANGTILGLLKTIPQEMSWLTCNHVDLPAKDVAADATALVSEAASYSSDREAAWRDGARWVSRLEQVDFQNGPKAPERFKQGGLYILTGGLGGIGTEVAKHLLNAHKARLLILGRTPLPDRKDWPSALTKNDSNAERIRAYQELETLGEIVYDAVDISNQSALNAAVDRAKAHWSAKLDGVLHLAGLYQERILGEENNESFAAVLAPKVLGTLALHELVKENPDALFLTFSSVYGFFGAFSLGAYAAANAFLSSFADYQRQSGMPNSQCLSWSMWDETGMSRGFGMKQLSRSRGYYIMRRDQGIFSLAAATGLADSHLFLGLDGSKAAIRRHLDGPSHQLQALSGYFVTQNDAAPNDALKSLSVEDRYRTSTTCHFTRIEKMPLTAAGEIDRHQLSAQALESQAESEPPQTETEEALAAVWAEVLDVTTIGRNDNFFDLGGHSLSAVQITFKIRQAFNVDFPLKAFLEAPVLSAQATQLEEKLLAQADDSELEQFMKEIEPTL